MYSVAVKIEGMDRRRRTTGLMHAVVGFFLLIKSFDYYQQRVDRTPLLLLPFLFVAALSIFYGFFRTRVDAAAKYNNSLRILQFMIFVSFALVMRQSGHRFDFVVLLVWACVTFLMVFSEKRIFADTSLQLTNDGILIPGSYNEHLVRWAELESVTVRHDFITLFHRGKKYLQYQVLQDLSELEVVKMNAYCREKIEANPAKAG